MVYLMQIIAYNNYKYIETIYYLLDLFIGIYVY